VATHATISQAKGSTGAEVSQWQTLLATAGHPVEITGVFDAATTAATKAWQAANGLTADGVVGPQSWAKMTGETPPPVYNQAYGSKAQFGRQTLLAAWPDVMAEGLSSKYPEVVALAEAELTTPLLSTIQTFQAMAQLESAYGLASYKGPSGSKVLNNWGAVQAGKPPCGPGSFEVGDTGAGGAYTYCYKDYPTPEAGALDFLRHLTLRRPYSWQAAKTGDLDLYSVRMHSWDPPLTSLGQGSGNSKLNLDPITKTPGYFEQPPLTSNGRARGLYDRAFAISQVLGEPLEVARGGPFVPGVEPGPDGEVPGGGTTGGIVGLLLALGAVAGGVWAWQSGALGRIAKQVGIGRR
jgi:peptidoglycan hydrolase-like protein with peptidoglycan-binding domain